MANGLDGLGDFAEGDAGYSGDRASVKVIVGLGLDLVAESEFFADIEEHAGAHVAAEDNGEEFLNPELRVFCGFAKGTEDQVGLFGFFGTNFDGELGLVGFEWREVKKFLAVWEGKVFGKVILESCSGGEGTG